MAGAQLVRLDKPASDDSQLTPTTLLPETAIQEDISQTAYQAICMEIRDQPQFRVDQNTDCDYYDGMQAQADLIFRLQQAGIPMQDSNFIKPTINAMLGLEAKTRTDYKVASDDDDPQMEEVATALSAKLKEAEGKSRADRALSDAYASQIKAGLGWIEVGREFDPLAYPYRVRDVHRKEIYWDWNAKEPDLRDARYLRRDRWIDRSQAMLMLPESAAIIEGSYNNWTTPSLIQETGITGMIRGMEAERQWWDDRSNWVNPDQGMVCLSELWYRYWKHGFILRLPNGNSIAYDENNQAHVQAVANRQLIPYKALLSKVRMSMWCGPHKLFDVPTPYPHQHFPYIPLWGFRKDKNKVPYGMVRDMRGPQDQIIDLDIMIYEALNSQRVIADNDSIDVKANSYQDVAERVNSLRAFIILNSNRRNKDGFSVHRDAELVSQLFQLIQERKNRIEEISGIYRAMLGQQSNASSGIAINSLVEQGSTTMAEINDNFRYSRRMVGEQLLALIKQDFLGRPHQVTVRVRNQAKKIFLNQPIINELKQTIVSNDVATAQVNVVLEDVPATPTFRAQQLQGMAEMAKAAPPNMQMILYPAMLELSDLSNRHELADQMRKAAGLPTQAMSPEQEKQAIDDQQAAQRAAQHVHQQAVMLDLQTHQVNLETAQVALQKAKQELATGGDSAATAQMTAKISALQATAAKQLATLQGQIVNLTAQLNDKNLQLTNKDADLEIRRDEVQLERDRLAAEERMAEKKAEEDSKVREADAKAKMAEADAAIKAAEAAAKAADVKLPPEVERQLEAMQKSLDDSQAEIDELTKEVDGVNTALAKAKDEQIKALTKQTENAAKPGKPEKETSLPPINIGPIVIERSGDTKTIEITSESGKKYSAKVGIAKPSKKE
ncbi:MAG: phage portal protein [Pyrinomonadaceae bacterium]